MSKRLVFSQAIPHRRVDLFHSIGIAFCQCDVVHSKQGIRVAVVIPGIAFFGDEVRELPSRLGLVACMDAQDEDMVLCMVTAAFS